MGSSLPLAGFRYGGRRDTVGQEKIYGEGFFQNLLETRAVALARHIKIFQSY
jgi:hypothetical protein